MSLQQQQKPMATAAAAPPSLLTQVGMAGTAAVITVSFIHPIDVVKTRIQISSEYGKLGMGGTISKITSNEGVMALWKGVNAAWLREASYTSLRLGLYEPVKVLVGANDPETTTFLKKFAAGSAAGAIGSLAGNPFDVLKTKMMASAGKEVPSIGRTAKELFAAQGIQGFYRGIDSNIARAMVLNGTKMACYDQAKGYVVATTGLSKQSIVTQFLSAVAAGFFMTCTVSPFDMVRTRLMNQPSDAKIYNNAVDCMIKIAKNEGPATFWRGFFPIWSRFAPTTTIQLVIFEQLRGMMGMKSI
ncbi:Probable mitochondrial 2-oxoglutarate/malate carrier protein [Seminavis robusta]|uniref:Probable mitochondrial 2-oxoglutarate/malate carrier protein n=1 Tax=Seminavis robusta TaxID=568900 RepID=A0A9N8H4S6_9STRA|nr:Probable mitochondrial 2-oxoglutarate/malate carrier protein [Seminavis robusta]|eukprot:Sro93_g048290.1 Probable mitochondrial 2-oxoglutarate/malate carrier protein (301) ;mRNA; r:11333-12574